MSNIKQANKDTFEYAKKLWMDWELVAFPTETVYWLWADALNEKALKKIFELKKRPSDNPLIVHLWDKSEISKYAVISNPIEQKIIGKLMPWPLTILLSKKDNISNIISQNSYVWIRIPSNQVALELLQHSKLAIAAPSANISTKPSATTAQMVKKYFPNNLSLIVDGWESYVGIESTVLRVEEISQCNPMWEDDCKISYKIIIYRPWFVTKEDLEILFDKNKNVSVEYSNKITNISPWNLYQHYSPDAKVHIISDLKNFSVNKSDSIALILTEETIKENEKFLFDLPKNTKIIVWWTKSNLITCAQNLFKIYYQCDLENIKKIIIEQLDEVWFGISIMNRVRKSAEK